MATGIQKAEFKLTKKRLAAVEMVVDGMTDKDIAAKLKVHSNTIFNWRHRPEFAAACRRKLEEYAARTRLRRIRETGKLQDAIVTRLAEAISKDDLSRVSVYGREFHAMRTEERTDFGDNATRIEGKLTVDGKQEVQVTHTGARSFREFLEQNQHVIDVTPVAEAAKESPVKAVLEMANQLLDKTDILDQIHEEDKAAEHAEANAGTGT